MTVKKWNARLSLLTLLLLVLHEGYQLYAYITFYYNPTLSKVSGFAAAGCFVLSGIRCLGCKIHRLKNDRESHRYPSIVYRTGQRETAPGISPPALPR